MSVRQSSTIPIFRQLRKDRKKLKNLDRCQSSRRRAASPQMARLYLHSRKKRKSYRFRQASTNDRPKKCVIQKTETARKTALQNYRRIQSEKENGSRFDQHVPIHVQSQKGIHRPLKATKPLYSCNKTYVLEPNPYSYLISSSMSSYPRSIILI